MNESGKINIAIGVAVIVVITVCAVIILNKRFNAYADELDNIAPISADSTTCTSGCN